MGFMNRHILLNLGEYLHDFGREVYFFLAERGHLLLFKVY